VKAKDILKGKLKGTSLADAIQQKGMVKLNLLVPVGNQWYDLNTVYSIRISGKCNLPTMTDAQIITDLKKDYEKYKKIDKFKSMKRLYSILALEGKPRNHLLSLFNSDIGLAYKLKEDLKLIDKIKGSSSKPFIEGIKEKLATIAWVDENKILNLKKSNVPAMTKYLLREINKRVK